MGWKTLDDMALEGQRVLVRADLNVPMDGPRVTDTTRLDRLAPTVQAMVAAGDGPILLALFSDILAFIGVVLTVWCALFFRDPPRVTPRDGLLIVSPADGRVCHVGAADLPAAIAPGLTAGQGDNAGNKAEGGWTRISIFMSVFDCHVNRAPVAGTVRTVAYEPGKFVNAELDKASEDNERNSLVIEDENGLRIGVVQIAGLVARRILCFSRFGDQLEAGERFGLIRFGSRLDVYVPAGVTPLVAVGQRAVAGETVIATRDDGARLRRYTTA